MARFFKKLRKTQLCLATVLFSWTKRTSATDVLVLLKEVLLKRKDLRLVVMSATLDAEKLIP